MKHRQAVLTIENKGVPKGILCSICKKSAKEGETVLWNRIEGWGHIVNHLNCLHNELFLEDQWQLVRESLISNGGIK
jgi:hypothetical protein